MKQRLLIAVFTVLVFGAGFAARMWTENEPAVPPPPAVGAEFVRGPAATPPAGDAKAARKEKDKAGGRGDPAANRAKLVADINRLRPQIDAYRDRLDQIDAEFDRDLMATVLTPDQREHYTERQKRNAERHAQNEAREAADTTPLSDEQVAMLQQRPLWNVLWSVVINGRLERLNRDIKLDDAQQAKVRELMRVRREKFLALVDSTPPPSITLSQLATQARKLGEPKK